MLKNIYKRKKLQLQIKKQQVLLINTPQKLYRLFGDIEYLQKNYEQALEHYNSIISIQYEYQIYFKRGITHMKLKKYYNVIDFQLEQQQQSSPKCELMIIICQFKAQKYDANKYIDFFYKLKKIEQIYPKEFYRYKNRKTQLNILQKLLKQEKNQQLEDYISCDYTCPITQTTMILPGLTSCGQLYDKKAILKHLDSHDFDPLMRETLASTKVYNCHLIIKLIDQAMYHIIEQLQKQ